jgi:hypothetical protein
MVLRQQQLRLLPIAGVAVVAVVAAMVVVPVAMAVRVDRATS